MSLEGYAGRSLEFLESIGAGIGDRVSAGDVSGRLMPRYEGGQDGVIVLKLANSYNVAVPIDRLKGAKVEHLPQNTADPPPAAEPPKSDTALPRILLLSTGGTIASRIDYVTGAVTPVLDAASLTESVPELAKIAVISSKVILSEHSENITPEHWIEIARAVDSAADESDGIVLTHGTDTMQYTASYLSFALAGLPKPVVMVGSQRSSDRPSSDAAENLIAAVRLAASGPADGVYVAMHEGQSDGAVSCHRGTRVRKCHTSARGAFETVGGGPAFTVAGDTVRRNDTQGYYEKGAKYEPRIGVDPRAALLKYHPGMDGGLIGSLVGRGCRAIILEGTGLGHVGRHLYGAIEEAVKGGVLVAMASQCVAGEVNMNVYESGRRLQNIGVFSLGDMLAETALVKAMWALSQSDDSGEVRRIMLQRIASETSG